jgi:hypothetical protein
MTDVFLYSVPSDTNPNDVRLVDPTQAASTGTISVSAAQTLADISQTATVTVPISVSATQTLGGLAQSANVTVSVSVSAAQTLTDLSQTATITVPVGVTATQTLTDLSQSATVAIRIAASAAQTLDDLVQTTSVEFAVGDLSVSAGQTLDDITQDVALNVVPERVIGIGGGVGGGRWVRVDGERLPVLSVTSHQTLADVISTAVVEIPVAAIAAQRLDDVVGCIVVEMTATAAQQRNHTALSLLLGCDVVDIGSRRTTQAARSIAALKLLAEAA